MERLSDASRAVLTLAASITLLPTLTHAQQADSREDDGCSFWEVFCYLFCTSL